MLLRVLVLHGCCDACRICTAVHRKISDVKKNANFQSLQSNFWENATQGGLEPPYFASKSGGPLSDALAIRLLGPYITDTITAVNVSAGCIILRQSCGKQPLCMAWVHAGPAQVLCVLKRQYILFAWADLQRLAWTVEGSWGFGLLCLGLNHS